MSNINDIKNKGSGLLTAKKAAYSEFIVNDPSLLSKASLIGRLLPVEREAFYASLTPEDVSLLEYDWDFWARPKQKLPPGVWNAWIILAGRGFGKTRTGAETVRMWKEAGASRIALIGKTRADVRDVMIEGESGIISCSPKWDRPQYIASKRKVVWDNGAVAYMYSADEPEQLRGPQHEYGWLDELAKFKDAEELLAMFEMGLRLGESPQYIVTTTPKPTPVIKRLVNDPTNVVTTGNTFENFDNLSEKFIERVVDRYVGTRIGRQEIFAELFKDVQGALWTQAGIDSARVSEAPGEYIRVVVAVDPAVSNKDKSDETGIIIAGQCEDGHYYIMEDKTIKAHVSVWAKLSVKVYNKYLADVIVGEVNNGGDLIETVIRQYQENINFKAVHATKGKYLRAEPIAALYERGLVHHVGSNLQELEVEMSEWVPGDPSPNRVDALVWALTYLAMEEDSFGWVKPVKRFI